jgi:gas vesicle protein
MGTRADEIRNEIESTRGDLSETIDEINDRVNPKRIAKRGKERAQRRFHSVREKVMGAVDVDAGQVEDRFNGNPLAAGLIAFGVGALTASLLPPDRASREAAVALTERAKPVAERLKGEAKEIAESIGSHVGDTAKESAQHLQESAKESVAHVKSEAKSSGEHVKDESRQASEDVRQTR